MQPEDQLDEAAARDAHTLAVAGHGVNPESMPTKARHRKSDDDSFGWRDLLLFCGIPVLIVILLRIFLIGFYVIPSGSMEDTIEPGDHVVANKVGFKMSGVKRGDIIVFKDPNNWLSAEKNTLLNKTYLIKRVIGIPGDTVACAGAGEPITVNGVAIDESSYIREGSDPSSFAFSVTVTKGNLFVMGDNRANSADSRYHTNDGNNGLVPISDVEGTAMLMYWPLNHIKVLDSHHDVFVNVPDRDAEEQ